MKIDWLKISSIDNLVKYAKVLTGKTQEMQEEDEHTGTM